MEEIDFTLMSNLAEEVEREHEGLLPFTEMVNILLAKYYAAQQSVQSDVLEWCGCEGFTPTMENGKCSACGKNAHR